MKAVDVLEKAKKNHIIEQLHEKGFKDTEGKDYKELRHKLAVIRAMEIDVSKDENRWV
ncbi:hypothetical protein [Salinibacillus xinjiangensis]|uniref:Uncharacterized protein n=1 Tax=Salinibacillus xinjiangensis TaxID=1229268 RepID=A0A6G1X7K1_9BACI|nr:hypothetical protein [Salinibacillus xinjiangensis]MRG86981.1 hypothetical protein [Salinibacillus xinjiangensis]